MALDAPSSPHEARRIPPARAAGFFPPALPTSSAGVPITLIVSPASSATFAAPSAAPTAEAAMMLWPHAWPMPGRQSYSAQIPMCRGPVPALARNAVGRPQIPFLTANPASASDSHSHSEAFSSSKPSSGWAWMRWLRPIKLSRAEISLSCAAPFGSISRFLSLLEFPGSRIPRRRARDSRAPRAKPDAGANAAASRGPRSAAR